MSRFDDLDLAECQQLLAAVVLAERGKIFPPGAGFRLPAIRAELEETLAGKIEKIPQGYRTVTYAPGRISICLGCHRRKFGMGVNIGPPSSERRDEVCGFCGGRTNYGLYLELEG